MEPCRVLLTPRARQTIWANGGCEFEEGTSRIWALVCVKIGFSFGSPLNQPEKGPLQNTRLQVKKREPAIGKQTFVFAGKTRLSVVPVVLAKHGTNTEVHTRLWKTNFLLARKGNWHDRLCFYA